MVGINMQDYSMDFVFKKRLVSIDIFNKRLEINGSCFPLAETYNMDIIAAENEGSVYLSSFNTTENLKNTSVYLSARNILTRKFNENFVYMDILIYTDEDIFDGSCVGRSKGHVNDINEIEVFQVFKGKILSLFINQQGEKYYGIFEEGEYYHIPRGWFHCTYILEGPAVVANFYMKAFWEADLAKKPYYGIINDVSIEKNEGSIWLVERNGRRISIENVSNYYKQYEEIADEFYRNIKKYEEQSIFELFQSDCYADLE